VKKIIRKILKEEVHSDYENLVEGDNYKLGVSLKELKLMVYILKNYPKSKFGIQEAFKELGINNEVVLTKFILIIMFNSGNKILKAYQKKDVSNIYDGPFYKAEVEYYSDIYTDTSWVEKDCYDCDGSGLIEKDCYECDGSGSVEDESGENVDCYDCDGSGSVDVDCDVCMGVGYVEIEEEVERINYERATLFAKQPITMDLLGDDIEEVIKNKKILFGHTHYLDSEYEYNLDEEIENTIEDLYGEDIIVSGENEINNMF
jgi:hypothetical protein